MGWEWCGDFGGLSGWASMTSLACRLYNGRERERGVTHCAVVVVLRISGQTVNSGSGVSLRGGFTSAKVQQRGRSFPSGHMVTLTSGGPPTKNVSTTRTLGHGPTATSSLGSSFLCAL